jgi:hypothetical protein
MPNIVFSGFGLARFDQHTVLLIYAIAKLPKKGAQL